MLAVSLSGRGPSILLSQDRSVCLNAPLGRFIAFATAKFLASIGSFQGLPAEVLEVILLPQRLALKYNTTPPRPCQHFLTDFFIFFAISFGGKKTPQPEHPLLHRYAHLHTLAYWRQVRYYILYYIILRRRGGLCL